MATYSKTLLAFPDGFTQAQSQVIFLQDTLTAGSATNPQASFNSCSGWYNSIPKLCLSGSSSTIICPLISVNGFDEAYLYPVNASAATAALDIYLIWGDNQLGGESSRWLVQHFYSTGTMTTSSGGMPMTSAGGTAYTTFTGLGTPTTGMSKILEDTVGCTTSVFGGTSSQAQVYGFPHLGGADYMAICSAAPAAANKVNCYVRLG